MVALWLVAVADNVPGVLYIQLSQGVCRMIILAVLAKIRELGHNTEQAAECDSGAA